MIIKPIRTRIFKEGEDLFDFVSHYLKNIQERSVVVVTSKIAALSEGRTAEMTDIKTKERLILEESELAMPTKYVWLTVKDGAVMASAGIDESNADGKLILLPRDSFAVARSLRIKLMRERRLESLGVLITDSRTIPLKAGVTGVAVGYAGFKGIKDYRGKRDIFGRKFHFSRTGVADSLASAAVLVMGEGDERRPLAVISGVPIEFRDLVRRDELAISIEDDMYRPLFSRLPRRGKWRPRDC